MYKFKEAFDIKEFGFVLKRFLPNKHKLSILSKNNGKIEIITRPIDKISQLWPGMLISFQKQNYFNHSNIVIAENIEVILFPEFNNFVTINWIHKQLEIIYYFSPLNSPDKELFEHIYNCFKLIKLQNYFQEQLYIIEKIYTIKLLEILGIYPTNDLLIYLSLYVDINSIYTEQLSLKHSEERFNLIDKNNVKILKDNLLEITTVQIEKIDNWILKSIGTHPNFKYFKTICCKKLENFKP